MSFLSITTESSDEFYGLIRESLISGGTKKLHASLDVLVSFGIWTMIQDGLGDAYDLLTELHLNQTICGVPVQELVSENPLEVLLEGPVTVHLAFTGDAVTVEAGDNLWDA
jgi:hypothetical protein